jgi:hypothetical protein
MENHVIDKLKEYGIDIYSVKTTQNDEILITAENMTIVCERNEVFVNFHITTKPSYAARIILILKEIKRIKLSVGADFVFDENGKFMDGEEANKYNQDLQKKLTISQFLEQQQQLFILSRAKSYNC